MINIALTVGGFVLLKGVFLMLFAHEHRQTGPISQLDVSNASHTILTDLNNADYKEVSVTDVAA